MNAMYLFKVPDFQGGYFGHAVRVEVIGETNKSYRIKFLEFGPNGHRPGDVTCVSKKSVRFDNPVFAAKENITYRLPYADK